MSYSEPIPDSKLHRCKVCGSHSYFEWKTHRGEHWTGDWARCRVVCSYCDNRTSYSQNDYGSGDKEVMKTWNVDNPKKPPIGVTKRKRILQKANAVKRQMKCA